MDLKAVSFMRFRATATAGPTNDNPRPQSDIHVLYAEHRRQRGPLLSLADGGGAEFDA